MSLQTRPAGFSAQARPRLQRPCSLPQAHCRRRRRRRPLSNRLTYLAKANTFIKQTADGEAASVESVEKVAERRFFEFSRVLPLAHAPGRQNPKGMKTKKVFIRSDVHAVRAGICLRGSRPLTTPGVFDRMSGRRSSVRFCVE